MKLKFDVTEGNPFEKTEIEEEIIRVLQNMNSKLTQENLTEDEINVCPFPAFNEDGSLAVDIAHPDIITLDDFPKEDLEETKEFIAQGKYVPHVLGAGAASRLGKGPMFTKDMINLYEILMPKDDYEVLRKPKFKLCMGERHFFGYRAYYEKLAKELKMDPKEVLANQKIVLHLNEEIIDEVTEIMKKNNFFGFKRENIIFLIQDSFPAYQVEGETLSPSEDGKEYPYGHGYTLLQLKLPNTAMILDENGKFKKIKKSAIDHLLETNSQLIGAHRINDLTRISQDPISLLAIHYSKQQIEKNNKDIVIELGGNPTNQKGGKWLSQTSDKNKPFLVETLNAKTQEWQDVFAKLEEEYFEKNQMGIPYNVFKNIYNLNTLKDLLEEGFPISLRIRDEGLTLEVTSGDLTQSEKANCAGFMEKDQIEHAVKAPKDLNRAMKFILRQDEDEVFTKIVKETQK